VVDLRLAGKRALVAGAGQGIGRATALLLAAGGARVACMEIDDHRRAAIVKDIEAAVAATVETFGGIDVAVDIVGEARWNPVLLQTDADWEESFALVLRHVFCLFQAAGARMVEQRAGALVAVASVSGFFAAPLHAAYGAAKAGLVSLVKTFAVELAPKGVRVNAVAPGAIRTPRVLAITTEERREASARSIPLGRMGEPEEIAKAVVFLASDLASYVTGQTLMADGGASVKFPLALGNRG
jgi:NAD(P)-dependent dehydrogenase (short-subunit alcohol dehydrogenase family)